MTTQDAIIIHNRDECQQAFAAAKESGASLVLQNPAGSLHYMGLLYIHYMFKEIENFYPDVPCQLIIDCDEDSNGVQAALELGHKTILYSGPAEIADKLQDIAMQYQATVITINPSL